MLERLLAEVDSGGYMIRGEGGQYECIANSLPRSNTVQNGEAVTLKFSLPPVLPFRRRLLQPIALC